MFVVRIHIYPAVGKEGEARDICQKLVKSRQGRGIHDSLQVQLFSEGTVLVGVSTFDTLADYEKTRKERTTDPEWQEAVTRLNSTIRAPSRTDIFEFVIPPLST